MARPGLDHDRVVAAAAQLADAEGPEALTLARVATVLGVRPPSLYNHVDGLEGLRRGIARRALRELGAELRAAATGRSGPDALMAVATAYRAYARAHPGGYALVQTPDPALAGEAREVVQTVLDALRGYDLGEDDGVHAARAFRSAVHGFVTLEAAGGFGIPVDVEESFRRLVVVVAAGLDRRPAG
ncbi:TetR/AcrR family transcriptional regulator [Baekduia soli]|uniref:TetR/AcrR family transcriptional regulator n=1 Tax=Baekduia soli TaxID=496014 RepID=A0A5B8U7G1_9ACTN|nr:TetR-like C-terminal domain-containing protein [Baekduia soli]QEC49069.1 TetR/AcrR family transcriptional regulator [Baekduia soli]